MSNEFTNNDEDEFYFQKYQTNLIKQDSYNADDELYLLNNQQAKFEDCFDNWIYQQNLIDQFEKKNEKNYNDDNDDNKSNFNSEIIIPEEETEDKGNIPTIKRPKFQNKSYCRYILLYVFRTIESEQYAEQIAEICLKYKQKYDEFKNYYRNQRILIMGYQNLKKELIMDNDNQEIQNRKMAFKEILFWYMNTLATKHILNSKKQDLQEYIKFKNYVMYYYIHNPKTWNGNKPEWLQKT